MASLTQEETDAVIKQIYFHASVSQTRCQLLDMLISLKILRSQPDQLSLAEKPVTAQKQSSTAPKKENSYTTAWPSSENPHQICRRLFLVLGSQGTVKRKKPLTS